MMGHADITTTTIYVHHVPQTDAAARLTALVDPKGPSSRRVSANL
jgi:site-specific recombinase XerD